jgi:hypothetical protein
MELTKLNLENLGPIAQLDIDFPPFESGKRKPVVFVGRNGSGKTITLSSIADALIELSALRYPDTTTHTAGHGRNWFRMVGPLTIKSGTKGSLSFIQFKAQSGLLGYYLEKGGETNSAHLAKHLPSELANKPEFKSSEPIKVFEIQNKAKPEALLEKGVYIYFPCSRNEIPSWVNQDAVPATSFKISASIQGRNPRKVIVDSALPELKQWLLSVLVDSKAKIRKIYTETGSPQYIGDDLERAHENSEVFTKANSILGTILGSPSSRFEWLGRHSDQKLGFVCPEISSYALTLEALSTGQSSLLGIFLTILMYCDLNGANQKPEDLNGICLIDEIDAHLHVQLANEVVPKLIQLFPNIQFVLSAHSPTFLVSMENHLGADGVEIIQLPEGRRIPADEYDELNDLMRQVARTEAFKQIIENDRDTLRTYVFVEGPTDHRYITSAINTLGLDECFKHITINPICNDKRGLRNGGYGSLTKLGDLLENKLSILSGKLVLVYDCDSKCQVFEGKISSIKIGEVVDAPVKKGIENLFSTKALQKESLKEYFAENGAGKQGYHVRDDRKMALCEHICASSMDVEIAETFRPLIEKILELSKREYTA